jgi:opacity protein-like surface antigen
MDRLISVAALAALLSSTTVAAALYEDEAGAVAAGASLRTTTAAAQYYDSPLFVDAQGLPNRADVLTQTQLRLTLDGYPRPWFGYELHLAQDLVSATEPGMLTSFAGTGLSTQRYRIAEGTWDWAQEGDTTATLLLDRANVRYHFRHLQLTIGRQAIGFGKARFWNPLDAFLPFDSRQFDREYKPGVDALRANVPLGDLSGIEVVGALGRDDGAESFLTSWRGSGLLGRVYGNLLGWDVSAQGGKVFGGYQLGGGLTGVVGPIEVRAEGAYFFPLADDSMGDHLVAVVGAGRNFDSSLNLQVEYLYNGAGDDADLLTALTRVETGRALQMSEHVIGALAAYDPFPLLTCALAGLVSASDGSVLVLPQLDYSVSDESTLTVGAMVAAGRRPAMGSGAIPELRSEFGTYPNFYFLQYRVYF